MSITSWATPAVSHAARPSSRLSFDDSRSGMRSARTRDGPSALAASTTETDESTPPLTPRTTPFRRNLRETASRMKPSIRRASAARSM